MTASVQIPNLPAGIALNGTELLEAVQAGTSVYISTSQIASYASSTFVTPSIGSVTANSPLTASTVSGAVTIGLSVNGVSNTYLAQMSNNTIKANISGGTANPSDVTATSFLDAVFGSTVGNIIARGSSGWTSVGIGTNTQILASNGSGNLPFWQSFSSEMDNVIGSVQGSIAYRNATSWVALPPGSSGQILQSGGSNANPSWYTVTGTGTVTQINTGTGLTGGPITTSGTISVANTGVSAGTYGSSYQVPVFVVNTQGQLTSVTNTTINAVTLTTGTITTTPTNSTDIVNKAYVDAALNQINYHAAANYATTADLGTVTYSNGSSGVGATITKTSPFATFAVDGANPTVGQRILVKNESNGAYNGVYTVTSVGSGSVGWVLTRATDFDQVGTGANEIAPGDYIFVISGSTNANTAWVQTTDFPITVGTTALVFTQVAGTGTYTAGTGLTLAGNQFSITNTTVSAGSYGSASSVPNYTVNAQGQLTSAASTSIAIDASAITSGTLPIVRGGTNSTATPTAGGVGYGTGTAHAYTAAGTSGQYLTSNGAGAPTWTTISAGVSSVSQTFTGGLISVSGSPITSSGTLALTVAGTSGGIVYFSSASTWASSAVLAANAIMIGGGAGVAPSTTTTGTGVVTAIGNAVNGTGGLITYAATALPSLATVGTITSGVWNGTTIGTGYGGTGLTGFTAANNAIYSTSSSALTAGTLPIAAGGTGQITANAALNALLPSQATNSGKYLTTDGTNSSWATVAAGVTSFQTSLSGLAPGSSSTGAITLSGTLGGASGGTGVNNGSSTITIGGSVTLSGAYTFTGTLTGITSVTFPTSGTLATTSNTVSSFSAGTTGLTPSTGTTGAVTLAGTLVVGNGGTGATTLTGVLKGNGTSAISAATAGTDFVAPGTATTFTATQTFNGSTSTLAEVLVNAAETTTVSATAATGTINFDVTTQSVLYYTSNASANWTVNFRGSSGTSLNTLLSTNQTVTVAFLVTQGATAYYNSAVTIDGTSVTPKWQGGSAPTSGNASSIDIYTYTIVKTASATYTVFASQTKFA